MTLTTSATPVKGNVVQSIKFDFTAIILATTKDGKRGLVHRYDRGSEHDAWMPLSWFSIKESGECECFKCSGSGLYYSGGAVVNGVYTGKTGPCFGCEGKGKQNDADRVRCHIYFRDHYTVAI